jgi:mannosyl-3-phosphoglycerate phosphatase
MRTPPVVTFVDVDTIPVPDVASRGRLAHLLASLARERIVLVFCSGRTRAEVESTRQAFGVFHPFITESGGAAFIPERYFGSAIESSRKVGGYEAIEFATRYDDVVAAVRRTSDRLNVGVLGFNDMSVEQVGRECGLTLLEARLAKLRDYSEPFRLLCANPIAERRVIRALEGGGLACRRGPGFHVATAAKGPQAAVAVLTTLYRVAFGSVFTAAAAEGTGAAEIVPHVDAGLDPIVLEPGDPEPGLRWLEQIFQAIEAARALRSSASAVRIAR